MTTAGSRSWGINHSSMNMVPMTEHKAQRVQRSNGKNVGYYASAIRAWKTARQLECIGRGIGMIHVARTDQCIKCSA